MLEIKRKLSSTRLVVGTVTQVVRNGWKGVTYPYEDITHHIERVGGKTLLFFSFLFFSRKNSKSNSLLDILRIVVRGARSIEENGVLLTFPTCGIA